MKATRIFGRLLLVVACLVSLAFFLKHESDIARQRIRAEEEQRREKWNLESFADVQAGHVSVTVMDAGLIVMLADDPQCVETVKSLVFFCADLSDSRYARVRDLVNVDDVGFYSCHNVDDVMAFIKDMQAVQSLFFEVSGASDENLRLLAEMPSLERVHFEQMMDDAIVEELRTLLPAVEVEAEYLASSERPH